MDKKSRDLVMGKLYLKNKDYKMAEKSFSEYLSSNPEDFQALKMLAQVQEHLNDTAKAFDFYQRCYLSQPDRKGVLLDICRLLLVNDPRLDHVDKKKWLKLAVQAFPTNPIVTNLRESLPNGHDSHPGSITTEDMIMEKLTFLEDRFKNFEDWFKNFEDGFKSFEDRFKGLEDRFKNLEDGFKNFRDGFKNEPQIDDKLKNLSIKQVDLPTTTTRPVTAQPVLAQSTLTPSTLGSSALGSSALGSSALAPSFLAQPSLAQPVTSKPDLAQSFLPKSTLAQPAIPKTAPTEPATVQPTTVQSVSPQLAVMQPPTIQPTVTNSTNLFGSSSFNPSLKLDFKPSNSNNAFKFDGINLFAESLKKLNLPTEGSWTTPTPKKDEPKEENEEDGNDDDAGVVATEELPIENTCDMKPIEIKTGEEDEDIVFKQRCKLYRFRDKEYKERGLGDIKVLKHRDTGSGRLIMRRELINLVCLNCWSCSSIERVRDTQVRFAGLDASDGDAEMTVFLAKFKTQELTDEFMKHLNELFKGD